MQNRTERLFVRVTSEEKNIIRTLAGREEMTITEYLVELVKKQHAKLSTKGIL